MNLTLAIHFRTLSLFNFFITLLSLGGCGYGFQNSSNPLFFKEGIQKIYVEPFINNTYKVGVENIVYHYLIRSLISHRKVTLVESPQDADAILSGIVEYANFSGSSSSSVEGLSPSGFASSQNLFSKAFPISTEYLASLRCEFILNRMKPQPGKPLQIWSSNFLRTKFFPAANQLDVPGTTSALINESEFERALQEIAGSMMDDVHEAMLAMF